MTGGRTFTYLGPNSAFLNVNMTGNQVMADGASIRTWTFGGGFNNDRSVPSPVIEAIEGQLVAPGERYDILAQLPAPATWIASVDYFDIRLARILGTATTSITSQ